MTTSFRRLYAAYLAHRVNLGLKTRSAHTLNVHSLGLFGDARTGHVRAVDRLLKLQARINHRLDRPHAKAVVTKRGRRLNIYATLANEPTEREQSNGTGT